MAIITQYLFGSHARRDFNSSSDIDLLSVTNDLDFKSHSSGKLNVSFYPEPRFLEAASRGDLFLLHIYLEAVLIYDAAGLHQRMISAFNLRTDYSKEIQQATDLAFYICEYGESVRDKALLNRRIAWCTRTILIARSAERNHPIFNADSLVDFSGKPFVRLLLNAKNLPTYDESLIILFREFLSLFGATLPKSLHMANKRDFWYYFRNNNNNVALKLMDSSIISVAQDIYAA